MCMLLPINQNLCTWCHFRGKSWRDNPVIPLFLLLSEQFPHDWVKSWPVTLSPGEEIPANVSEHFTAVIRCPRKAMFLRVSQSSLSHSIHHAWEYSYGDEKSGGRSSQVRESPKDTSLVTLIAPVWTHILRLLSLCESIKGPVCLLDQILALAPWSHSHSHLSSQLL